MCLTSLIAFCNEISKRKKNTFFSLMKKSIDNDNVAIYFYFRWSQQLSGDTGFLGGSFRGTGARGAGSGSNQRHAPLPPGLLAKGFPPPQPHPLFPLPPTVSLGGLMSPRNSLPGLPSLGVPGLLSPQQFLAKRPSLQETPSEVGILICSNFCSEDA